jgi:hypothetical protein
MKHRGSAPITALLLAAATWVMACANSEGIDINAISSHRPATSGSGGGVDPTGLAGSGGPGSGGAGGSVDTTKTAGTPGAGGSMSAGTAGTGTQGQAGDGSAGSSGQGQAGTSGVGTGGNNSGQAGSFGGGFGGSGFGGSGFGGSAGGRGGTAGSATGFGGSTGGTTGRGGSGGTTGRGGTGGSTSPDAGISPDAGTETFTDVYNTILVTYCSGSSCHNPGSAHGLSFSSKSTAYSQLKSRVIAGDSAGSSLYQIVQSGAMPQGQAKLSAANLAKIAAWIDGGALNN